MAAVPGSPIFLFSEIIAFGLHRNHLSSLQAKTRMENESESSTQNEFQLNAADLRQAVAEGVISDSDGQRLISCADERNIGLRTAAREMPETAKGFNLVTVAYYFGAMLMISAC